MNREFADINKCDTVILMSIGVLLGSLWAGYNENSTSRVTNKCTNATKHFLCSKGSSGVNVNTGLFISPASRVDAHVDLSAQRTYQTLQDSLVINLYSPKYISRMTPVITLCPFSLYYITPKS